MPVNLSPRCSAPGARTIERNGIIIVDTMGFKAQNVATQLDGAVAVGTLGEC